MKFVDEAIIKVKAGDGGNGCISFRREKYIEFGVLMVAMVAMVVVFFYRLIKV
jgi:hypothetical protein